jgi:hypothetical protein
VLQTRRRDYNSVDHPPPSAERMMVAIERTAENAGERTAFARFAHPTDDRSRSAADRRCEKFNLTPIQPTGRR